jgi:hypothetical protein
MRHVILFLLATLFTLHCVAGVNPGFFRVAPKAPGSQSSMNLVVGFRGGINFAQPLVIHSNEVLQGPVAATLFEKKYATLFSNFGYQYAFMAMVYLKESTSLSFEPGFSTYRYKYTTLAGWTNGADATDYIEYNASHRNSLTYLEFPFILRHEFNGSTVTPFVSFGAFYGLMTVAEKKMSSDITRHTDTGSIPYETVDLASNNTASYIRSRMGITGGAGFFYPLGPVKLMVSMDAGLGLNNIVDESHRYSNAATTAGMYDIQDDLKLWSLNLNIGILFNTGTNQAGKAVECITIKRKK